MKALKHIIAGLLHYDLLVKLPDPEAGRRQRGGRESPTSLAQQFYNDKCSWRALELLLAANFNRMSWVLTFTYTDLFLPVDKAAADKFLYGRLLRKLSAVRRRRSQPLKYIYCTEGYHGKQENDHFLDDGDFEDKRYHHHMVLNKISAGDLDELRSLWPYGTIKAEPLDVHYYKELAKYLTKEAREFGRSRKGERTWHASLNLTKPTVEYIAVPDSLTLSPPEGAVGYEPFTLKNPYGYADCIGARYLIFPERKSQEYSYNQPRQRGRPPNNF